MAGLDEETIGRAEGDFQQCGIATGNKGPSHRMVITGEAPDGYILNNSTVWSRGPKDVEWPVPNVTVERTQATWPMTKDWVPATPFIGWWPMDLEAMENNRKSTEEYLLSELQKRTPPPANRDFPLAYTEEPPEPAFSNHSAFFAEACRSQQEASKPLYLRNP